MTMKARLRSAWIHLLHAVFPGLKPVSCDDGWPELQADLDHGREEPDQAPLTVATMRVARARIRSKRPAARSSGSNRTLTKPTPKAPAAR